MNRHNKFSTTLILLQIILLFSCKQNGKGTGANQEFGNNISASLADSLQQIGAGIQNTEIDPTKDNTIVGKQGTVIYISANSLINELGKPITSKTAIQLKENYSIADMVSSNLQTKHNDDILQTQGMIYLVATDADGNVVMIDKSKPIRMEFPVREKITDAKIFKGKRDDAGIINWEQIDEPSSLLVPFPIRTVAPSSFGECRRDFGITKDTSLWEFKTYYTYDDINKYENTLLATREFKARYYSYCMPDLTKIYIDNLDKNMWEIDELIVQYFIKDSTDRVNHEMNWLPPGINGATRTKEQNAFHDTLVKNAKDYGHQMVSIFKKFASEKLTKIDPLKKISVTTIVEMNKAFVAYDALEFGWVNVDYFYYDPKSENVKLIAKTNEVAPIINLIIPNRNVILTGIPKDDNTYYFTKKEDGYNKLPKGEKAIIIAISIVNNKLHFAEKEITIGQNEIETIELKETTAADIKTHLKQYGT